MPQEILGHMGPQEKRMFRDASGASRLRLLVNQDMTSVDSLGRVLYSI